MVSGILDIGKIWRALGMSCNIGKACAMHSLEQTMLENSQE